MPVSSDDSAAVDVVETQVVEILVSETPVVEVSVEVDEAGELEVVYQY